MKQPYNTALYYRLSRDDENFGDSVSIETQRTILQKYARDNGFHVVDEYIDDGWSGTNFDRPDLHSRILSSRSGKVSIPLEMSMEEIDSVIMKNPSLEEII